MDHAAKLKIRDILKSEFSEGELVTPKGKFKRVRVLGTVIDKTKKGKVTSLYVNDGSGTIRASSFDPVNVKKGDLVDLIGLIKTYQRFKYISLGSINRLENPNWELLRELEILKERLPKEEITDRERVLRKIEELDQGEGADYEMLLKSCKLKKEVIEKIVLELLKDGDIYEPRSGKLKSLR